MRLRFNSYIWEKRVEEKMAGPFPHSNITNVLTVSGLLSGTEHIKYVILASISLPSTQTDRTQRKVNTIHQQ